MLTSEISIPSIKIRPDSGRTNIVSSRTVPRMALAGNTNQTYLLPGETALRYFYQSLEEIRCFSRFIGTNSYRFAQEGLLSNLPGSVEPRSTKRDRGAGRSVC